MAGKRKKVRSHVRMANYASESVSDGYSQKSTQIMRTAGQNIPLSLAIPEKTPATKPL